MNKIPVNLCNNLKKIASWRIRNKNKLQYVVGVVLFLCGGLDTSLLKLCAVHIST